MWIIWVSVGLLFSSSVHAQSPSPCVQLFDRNFRQCFRDIGGFELEVVFSLVTNGTSGALPQRLVGQKQNLISTLCGNLRGVKSCIGPLPNNPAQSCQQADIAMMAGTVNSMVSGLGNTCGQPTAPPACLNNFDKGFRTCLQSANIVPDQFFMLLANQTLPQNVNRDQLKQFACSDSTRQGMMSCSTTLVTKLQTDCETQQTIMVGTTLQNMLGAYEGVCTGKTVNPNQCMAKFQAGMNTCATKTINMDMKMILMVMNNQTLPQGSDRDTMKKTICGQLKPLENCGKNVLSTAACSGGAMLSIEATFANMMITTATFCGDTSMPGACLLTLQKKFGTCFPKVGLDPAIYMGNDTQHRGALIGATTQEAQVYCSKKHDLFTCMQEVIHKCPGAEQTLSLTGFDLHGMERAVGILCHDIPHYLAGLSCFAKPTDSARQCMDDMTIAITDLSTKQITQKLSMDTFFSDFCSARVNHVACDGASWPTCGKPAVSLKNEFECQLIPSRCYKSHKDNIDAICPNTELFIPDTNKSVLINQQPACARDIHNSMNTCFQQFGLQPDMFLVNVTHDRRNFLGDSNSAKAICRDRFKIFQCMERTFASCPAAKDIVAFWGHQQSSLEKAIEVICRDLPVYNKGVQCFANANAQVMRCVTNTENRMMELADKQVTRNLTPDSYFRDFCSIRLDHLRCDLNGWGTTCAADVLGLKTEFECAVIQEHCKNLQVANYKTSCNDITFAKTNRQSGGPAGSATAATTSIATIVGGLVATIAVILV